jgi:hypothetical protein
MYSGWPPATPLERVPSHLLPYCGCLLQQIDVATRTVGHQLSVTPSLSRVIAFTPCSARRRVRSGRRTPLRQVHLRLVASGAYHHAIAPVRLCLVDSSIG